MGLTSGCNDHIDILSRAIDKLAMNFKIISEVEVNNFWANFGNQLFTPSHSNPTDEKNLKYELERFSLSQEVDTKLLLLTLIKLHIAGDYINTTFWMDRLVQRFEVSKKLYQGYLPGFRKGEGSCDNIAIYWLFSLALSFRSYGPKRLKYLNTLLKVCDLLGSLPLSEVLKVTPPAGLAAVIAVEITCVQSLVTKGEIDIE